MEELDKQRSNSGANEPQAAEELMRSMTQELEKLRQNLLVGLSEDVERLQKEKSQLIEEIDKLQSERQQQISQQQQFVTQIAPALANKLQELTMQRLNQLAEQSRVSEPFLRLTAGLNPQPLTIDLTAGSGLPPALTASDYNENAYRLIASLDSTLRTTFSTLQKDLNSYQSSLSQQLAQMYNLGQQGEAFLEMLVERLREEIQSQPSTSKNNSLNSPTVAESSPLSDADTYGYPEENYNTSVVSYPREQSLTATEFLDSSGPATTIQERPIESRKAWKQPLGFLLVLLSWFALSCEYLVVTVIFNQSQLFSLSEPIGGFISLGVGNALLILWLRMLVVVPLMAILATLLYPAVWRDLKQFIQSQDWSLFLKLLGSGFFLFLSQMLIYLALGSLSPGITITVFFIYPVVTLLLSWALFGVRLSLLRTIVIFSVLVGVALSIFATNGDGESATSGVSAAVASGIAFAFYIVLMQTCGQKLNPIPCSWINFILVLAFSSLSLALPLPESWGFEIDPTVEWSSMFVSSLVLGGATLLSYLLSNIGIRMIGASRASILGATVPALTAFLAFFSLQKIISGGQILGMLLVTLGVAALSFEQWRRQSKAAQLAAREG
ncbi:EamA family transporter [Lyngbya aestuarii]|uniref:EamA family transporter n=1 Tax=Lyngbya aestuarii TaxID=118322 RepID=UPI00403E2975